MGIPRKVGDLGTLSEAEEQVLADLDSGEVTVLGDGARPEAGDQTRKVSAGLIRLLMLGDDPGYRLHEAGLRIAGAWIPDVLNLEGCRDLRDLTLFGCRFDATPVFRAAGLMNLCLNGCHLPGLVADRMEATGNVLLRSGFVATGEVRLLGARIGGDLDCSAGSFLARKGEAALHIDGAQITGALYLREGAKIDGAFDATNSKIDCIMDSQGSWPSPGNLLLDGCHYRRLTDTYVASARRLDWLGLQDPARWGAAIWPQTYEQCAKVLREMGHGEDARAILIEKERLQRAARRARTNGVEKVWFRFWDALLGATVQYGQQPLRAFYWLACFWLVGASVFGVAEATGELKPNKEVVLRSDEWVKCAKEGTAVQTACYLDTDRGRSYPRFNRWVYSADTLLPIVSLEMQEYWIPDDRKGWPGWFSRGYLWVHIAVGWALSLLAVAGFSGLVKSD